MSEYSREYLELELGKQKTINYLIGEIIKYSSGLESLDHSMEKTIDMLMGILGLSAITISLDENVNGKSYCRSIREDMMVHQCSFTNKDLLQESMKVIRQGEESSLMVPLRDNKNGKQIGHIIVSSNNSEFFDSSILSFFEILSIQIPIIVSNAIVYEKMQYASIKDILTNCYNRKHLEKTINKIERENHTISLGFFDLDNFKFINDTFGHSVGDRILLDISEIALSYAIKYNADVFRYGGDEFIIIFYECPLDRAKEILDELRMEVMNSLSTNIELDLKQTISIGLANYPETVDSIRDLLEVADAALINGKSVKKNQVYIGEKNNEKA